MEVMSKLCFEAMEPLKLEEPRLCRHMNRWYPVAYCGRGKCHFRAAFNIHKDVAKALFQNRVVWDNVQGVLSEVDRHRRGGGPDVLRFAAYFVDEHWVSLVSIIGKCSAVYYDDGVCLVMSDFDLAADRLSMMHMKSTEMIRQMIRDGFDAPPSDLDQAVTGPMETPIEGVCDDGARGRAMMTGGRPQIADTTEHSRAPMKPTVPTPETEMRSPTGTWSPDTCSLGSSADVTPDDWRMLTPGTWCPDTPNPDTSSTFPNPFNLTEVNCSGAASIPTPVHVVAWVCVRIGGRAVFTKPKQTWIFFPELMVVSAS